VRRELNTHKTQGHSKVKQFELQE